MKVKEYAVQLVEKELDVIQDLVINNDISSKEAESRIEKIENLELVTNLDPSDIVYEMIAKSRDV